MTGSDGDAELESERAAHLTSFWKRAGPKGTVQRSELELDIPGLDIPDDGGEGVVSRDQFIVWLFKKPLGSPALLTAALKARACTLFARAEQAPQLSIWPDNVTPSLDLSDCEDIVDRFSAIRSAPACAAQHFLDVVGAGVDANSVVFPRMEPPPCRGKIKHSHSFSAKTTGEATATQPDKVPFPLPHGCVGAPHTGPPPDTSAWAPGADAEAGAFWLEGRAVDINQLRQFSFYMAQMDMELTPWPMLAQGVIAADECTVAQQQGLEFLELRGPRTEEAVKRRRRRYDRRWETPYNARSGEEIMPLLDREASLQEMHARWARDRAQEIAEHEAQAERGAPFVAWPSEGKWPPVDEAWQQRVKSFAAWKARPSLPALPVKPLGLKRADSTSSLKSWLSVSDISWIEVDSQASERGWEVLVHEADPELVEATDVLRKLAKEDIAKVPNESVEPPSSVVLTLEAVCALLEIEPSWTASVKLLADVTFVDRLLELRWCATQAALEAVSPYVASEDFTPEAVSQASKVCAVLCRWIRAVYKYHTLSHAAGKATHAELVQKPKEQLMSEAVAALNGLKKGHMQELKSFSKPPAGIDLICSCLVELSAGLYDRVELGRNGDPKVGWKAAQVLMSDPTGLVSFLRSFKDLVDRGEVPWKNVQRARKRRDDMGVLCTQEVLRKKSYAAAGIGAWVNHMLAYCELVMPPEPARAEKPLKANPPPDDGKAGTICKADIVELKCLSMPPVQVIQVVTAASMLLQNAAGDGMEANNWKGVLADVCFLNRLVNFDPKVVSKETLEAVEATMGPLLDDVGSVKMASKAAASLAAWVKETVREARAALG